MLILNPLSLNNYYSGSKWGAPASTSCVGQKLPISGSKFPGGPLPAELTLEKVTRNMSKPVNLLNITTLSQLRKDGHPSIYTGHGSHFSDCSHWCLPGVPDTWNILLYASLFYN